jgi:hypothetical protein
MGPQGGSRRTPSLLPVKADPLGNCVPRGKNLPQKRLPAKPKPARHTYLHVGDRVYHNKFKSWGAGIVLEAWDSDVPGGLCFVRVQFQDGKKRVFDNSYDSSCCCCYAGVNLINRIDLK